MAEGLGFKTFTTGEVLTSADVNGYLMQGVLVFASEAARDAAITSPQEGQFAFTKDNNSLWYYSGAAWVASGATGDIEGVTAGTGISGGGTSGTVTITNSMATEIDAKGDLVVGTGADTFARLAVGTDGYTLVADSGETTGLVWAAPGGASGMTLVQRTTFSSAASHTMDSIFTSTYSNYMVVIEDFIQSAAVNIPQLQLRYGANTETGGYYGSAFGLRYTSATLRTELTGAASQCNLWQLGSGNAGTFLVFHIERVGTGSSIAAQFTGQGVKADDGDNWKFGFIATTLRNYTGLLLKTSAGTSSCVISVYGLAK
jgi:hypothetical protein